MPWCQVTANNFVTRFILFIIRCFALTFSFILATLAAAIFITFALFLGGELKWLYDDPAVILASITFTSGIWFVAAQSSLLPFLGISAIAEFARLTSLMFHLLAGGLCSLVYLVWQNDQIHIDSDLPYSKQELWIAILAAGFVAGFIHWAIAGYRSGRWLGPVSSQN